MLGFFHQPLRQQVFPIAAFRSCRNIAVNRAIPKIAFIKLNSARTGRQIFQYLVLSWVDFFTIQQLFNASSLAPTRNVNGPARWVSTVMSDIGEHFCASQYANVLC